MNKVLEICNKKIEIFYEKMEKQKIPVVVLNTFEHEGEDVWKECKKIIEYGKIEHLCEFCEYIKKLSQNKNSNDKVLSDKIKEFITKKCKIDSLDKEYWDKYKILLYENNNFDKTSLVSLQSLATLISQPDIANSDYGFYLNDNQINLIKSQINSLLFELINLSSFGLLFII